MFIIFAVWAKPKAFWCIAISSVASRAVAVAVTRRAILSFAAGAFGVGVRVGICFFAVGSVAGFLASIAGAFGVVDLAFAVAVTRRAILSFAAGAFGVGVRVGICFFAVGSVAGFLASIAGAFGVVDLASGFVGVVSLSALLLLLCLC